MLGSADTNVILTSVQDSKISDGFICQSKNVKIMSSYQCSVPSRQCYYKCIMLKSRQTDSYGIPCYYHPPETFTNGKC